jgi:hypothetical protein
MIFFIHIPKNAGTSLLNCFQSLAGRSLLWYAAGRDLEHALPKAPCDILAEPETRERFKMYGGHFGLAQIKPYLRPDDLVLSVVRDPVLRAYSFYNHVTVNDKGHRLRPLTLGVPIIQASMRSSVFLDQISNHQCWFISGAQKFSSARQVVEENRVKVFPVTQAQSVVDLAAQALGVAEPPKLGSLNESQKPGYLSEMTDEERGFLTGINIEDQRFYNYVLERMQQQATPEGGRAMRYAAATLHTRAGRGVDGVIDYDGSQAGYVLFGPYCPLEPGAWRARFSFDPASTVANCEFNITHGRGREPLIAVLPRGSAVLQNGCVTLDFDLKEPVEDLECRMRAGGPGHGRFLELTIEPRDVGG